MNKVDQDKNAYSTLQEAVSGKTPEGSKWVAGGVGLNSPGISNKEKDKIRQRRIHKRQRQSG